MSIIICKPEVKRNWSKFIEHISLAALEGITLNIPNVIREIDNAATGTTESHRPDEVAWVWLYASLSTALYNIGAYSGRQRKINEKSRRKSIKELSQEAISRIEGFDLQPNDLINPADAAAMRPAIDFIADALKHSNHSNIFSVGVERKKFRSALRAASARVLALDHDYYAPLNNILKSPMTEGEQRDRSWQRHATWIRSLYERNPIFSIEQDKIISLRDVYQRLRAYWHEELPNKGDDEEVHLHLDRKRNQKLRAHIDHLHILMHNWLDETTATSLRIVAGGPGSGKSSFAKAFAVEVSDQTEWRVIFIELQNLAFDKGDLERRIGEYLTSSAVYSAISPAGTAGFPSNPLSWRADSSDPILLIFDGLDELSASDETSAELSRAFVLEVNNYLIRANANTGIAPIRAIILGRNTACQAGLRAATLSLDTLINVAALKPLNISNDLGLTVNLDKESNIVDPQKLRMLDQRKEYWKQWATLTGKPIDPVPDAITSNLLNELNAEPLLLHLLIQSGYTENNWEKAADNRNRVYREIFDRVLARNADKTRLSGKGLIASDAMTALECMGLAAWRGGGRTGGNEAFRELLELFAPRLYSVYGANDDLLSQHYVAVQFHTRQGFGDGYEFLHKSFGEYLTARALLSIAQFTARRMNDEAPESPKEAARRWCSLVASAEMTDFVLRFVFDEARLIAEQKDIFPIKDSLTQLFSWVQKHGMPVHEGASGTYREIENSQRCAETALLTVLSGIARAGRDMVQPESIASVEGNSASWMVNVDWPQNSLERGANPYNGLTAPRRMIQRLGDTWEPVIRLALSGLVMKNSWLSDIWFLNADLSKADLKRSHLVLANLTLSNLSEADLSYAALRSAQLSQSNFTKANLKQANLSNVDLSRANLTEANLLGADLSSADLSEANLRSADLTGANLFKANLSDADFSGAELTHTDFSNANTSKAIFHNVDLSNARNLTQEQVNSMDGSKTTTKLPGMFFFPEEWHDVK